MEYIKRPEDVKYRRVQLDRSTEPEFVPFAGEGERITYPDTVVLEVVKSSGETQLVYDNHGEPRRTVNYNKNGNTVTMVGGIPTARLWLRDELTGMEYKIPDGLPKNQNNYLYFQIGNAAMNLRLVGDKYFDKVYEIN